MLRASQLLRNVSNVTHTRVNYCSLARGIDRDHKPLEEGAVYHGFEVFEVCREILNLNQ